MSDDFDVVDIEQEKVIEAATTNQTWARKLMNGVREVQALHNPVTRFVEQDAELGQVFDTQEAAEASGVNYESIVICEECDRLSTTEWQEWPCRTSVALGIENGPLL